MTTCRPRRAALDSQRSGTRGRHAHPLRRCRRARGLRVALAVVGRGSRGLLGGGVGLLRRGRLLRHGARDALDAGRQVVPGRRAQLRGARLPRLRPRGDGHPSALGDAGRHDRRTGRSSSGRSPGRAQGSPSSEWAAATAWRPTCRTSRRRWSRSWPPRASGPPGRAPHPSSAPGAWWTASPRSSRRCCSPWTATATGARTSTASRSWPAWWPRCRRSSAPWCCRISTPS